MVSFGTFKKLLWAHFSVRSWGETCRACQLTFTGIVDPQWPFASAMSNGGTAVWFQRFAAIQTSNFSAGVWYCKVFLGRSLSWRAVALSLAWLKPKFGFSKWRYKPFSGIRILSQTERFTIRSAVTHARFSILTPSYTIRLPATICILFGCEVFRFFLNRALGSDRTNRSHGWQPSGSNRLAAEPRCHSQPHGFMWKIVLIVFVPG